MKSKSVRDIFAEAYARGLTFDEIAKTIGVSRRTALYWAREMCLPRRKHSPKSGRQQ
jgi:transposase